MARTKGGLNTKLHIAVDSHGLPVRMIVTDGNMADCTQAKPLIANIPAQYLMADKAYDTNDLLGFCNDNSIQTVIPPKRNRTGAARL